MPHCQKLKQKLNNISGEENIEKMKKALKKFKQSGDEDLLRQIERKKEQADQNLNVFYREFKEKAMGVLKKWCPQYRRGHLKKIKVEKGRIVVDGDFNFRSCTLIDYYPKMLTKVNGDLNLYNTSINELPGKLEVDGDLILFQTNIAELPDKLEVNGGLHLGNTDIARFPNDLKEVNGDLNLSNTEINELPNGLEVNGYLDLYDTNISELPDDFKVGGNLRINKDQMKLKAEAQQAVRDGRIKGEIDEIF